jgi:hypothetical protein
MITSKITQNFTFSYLSKNIEKFLLDYVEDVKSDFEKASKARIKSGLGHKLKQSTLQIRKKRGISGTKPLFATGNLYNSIKKTKEGLQILEYGLFHNKGFTTGNKSMIPNKEVPARTFINGKTAKFALEQMGLSTHGEGLIKGSAKDKAGIELAKKIRKALKR